MIDYDGLRRLAYQIKTETQKAANTALRVGTLFEDIIDALGEGDNSDLINSINKINTDISKIINQIKDINNDIDQTIIKRIEAAERNITNIVSNINTIVGDINTINSTLSNHTTMIESINGQITTINNNLTTLSNQITNINSTISSITSDLTNLTSRVTVNEADIADLRRQIINLNIDAIRESISNLESDLDDLERRVTTLEGDVIDLRTDLNAEIERAEATYAKKTDLPDMSDVFYKSKGGTVTKSTIFTDIVSHNQPIFMNKGAYMSFSSDKVSLPLLYFSVGDHSYNFLSTIELPFRSLVLGASSFDVMFTIENNAYVSRPNGGGSNSIYKVWDEGNDGHNSGLDADLLDGHHWTDFALKSDIPSLPDMTNVFYKNIGGTVTAETTFTQSVTHNNKIHISKSQLNFKNITEGGLISLSYSSRTVDLIGAFQAYTGSGSFPCTYLGDIGEKAVALNTSENAYVRKPDASGVVQFHQILHEGNSVYVVSAYPTDLSSYPDGAIFIKA